MKNQLLILFSLLAFSACQPTPPADKPADTTPAATAAVTLTEEEKAAGWKLLFDGQSLDQWRGYNRSDLPKLGWSAKDGQLVIESTPNPKPADFGGDIITKEKFGNFELTIDFLCSDTANSGIFYFVMEEKDSAMYHNAPEYQILDNETWIKSMGLPPNTPQKTGDNYDMESSAADYSKPVGEWNSARILHKDGKVEHWLNGQKCLEYEVGSPKWTAQLKKSKFSAYPMYGKTKMGHLGLQDHNHEVRFRNIKVRGI